MGVKLMRLEQLQYIITISKLKSFNAASEQLHISQQALSQSIKSMENELGIQLFTRTSQGAYITKKGELVLNFAEDTCEKYKTLIKNLNPSIIENGIHSSLRGILHIYSSPIFSLTILPDIIKVFCKKYPQIQINTTEANISTIYKNISAFECSPSIGCLGLLNLPCANQGVLDNALPTKNYRFQPIYKGRFYLCVSKNSKLSRHKTLSLNTISKYPIIQYINGDHENSSLIDLFNYYGYTPNIALTTGDIILWLKTIQNNVGVGFLHESAFLPDAPYSDQLNEVVTINCKEYIGSIMGCLLPDTPSPITYAFLDELPHNPR